MRFLLTLLTCSLVAGCGSKSTTINATGSTFVYPMMSKWTSEFDKLKQVKVNYQSTGSGAGIQQVISKTVEFGCTDAPMNEEQLAKSNQVGGKIVHVPLVHGAVVVAYNLEEVQEPLIFSGPVLADIYLAKIKKWNDDAIQKLNPNVKLPDKNIAVVHRSEGSGTTYIWVDYLSKVSPEWKDKVGVGTSVKWPHGIGQKGNEGIAGAVKRTPASIGYIELTYALQNNIRFGTVINREGKPIKPTLESVTAAAEGALSTIPDDLRFSLTDAPGANTYPISGTVWAVAFVKQKKGTGKLVADFLRWVTHEGQPSAEALHYARLPQGLVDRAEKMLDEIAASDK